MLGTRLAIERAFRLRPGISDELRLLREGFYGILEADAEGLGILRRLLFNRGTRCLPTRVTA